MLSLKSTAAGSIIAGGLAMAAIGLVPVANAAPSTPVISGPQWLAENGPGRGHGHGHHDDWWWDGPGHWDPVPVEACVGVQGPFGFVQGSACLG